MSVLAHRLLALHDSLTQAKLPHAFGGAIALAYCTEEPRGTRDLDVNVFVHPTRAREVFAGLPAEVACTKKDMRVVQEEGQVRLWWEDTPVDLFLDIHRFHAVVAGGVRWVPFMDHSIPVLGCSALAVFKALFNRTKDWADIEAMVAVGAVDLGQTILWLEELGDAEDPAIRRLAKLSA